MTKSGARLIVVSLGICCAWGVIAIPRPVTPFETPSLMLDRRQTAAVIEADTALAEQAPTGPEIDLVQELFLEQGAAEGPEGEATKAFELRRIRTRRAIRTLIDKHGEASLQALRAKAVASFEQALSRDEPDPGVMGSFLAVLERYTAVVDGHMIAPRLSLRAMYKARWNAILYRPLVEGLSDIEQQAYWGWLALHSHKEVPSLRASALKNYAAAGGRGVEEAEGVLAYWEGDSTRAANVLRGEYRRTGSLRLRNLSLGVLR